MHLHYFSPISVVRRCRRANRTSRRRDHASTRRRTVATTSGSGAVVTTSWSATRRSSGSTVSTSTMNAAALVGGLAERVVRPGREPLQQDLERSGQQDDVVELGMEPHLVLLAAGHEQDVDVLGRQQLLDGASRHC